jgi:hypothetical protein
MSEQPKGFTVNDRRHFAPDGSPRDARPEPPQAPASAPAGSGPRADAEPVDFGAFLLSLAAQATALLGIAAPEGEPAAEPDLAGARQIISILEMLKDKTEGRRSSEEDRLIAGILYELRMAWVARSRSSVA